MPRLDIADGYTLTAKTSGRNKAGVAIPVVEYSYRPALPEALYELRLCIGKAASGEAEAAAMHKFLVTHLVKWDVVMNGAESAPKLELVRLLPEPILDDMVGAIAQWKPKDWQEAAGNSSGE